MDENKKLLDEIDELEDEHENKEKKEMSDYTIVEDKKNNKSSTILIGILCLIIFFGIFYKIVQDEIEYNYFESNVKDELENMEKTEITLGEILELYEEDNDEDYYRVNKIKFQESKKNIVTEEIYKSNENNLILKIKNNSNNQLFNINVFVVFYDGEDQILDVSCEYITAFDVNAEFYFELSNTPEAYERYDICYSKTGFYDENYSIKTNNVELEKINVKDNVGEVTFKNKSSDKIDSICAVVLYYDENNKVCDMEKIYVSDLKRKTKEKFYGTMNFNISDYNNYEIKIIEAYSLEY